MDVSSSGRLKKMGISPDSRKKIENDKQEEVEATVKEELTETTKLRLARKSTEVDIDPENLEELDCPGCGKHMEPGMIICLSCEMDVKTGKKIKTKVKGSSWSKRKQNAYATPKANNDLEDNHYGGLTRGKYWLWSFLIPVISIIAVVILTLMLGFSMAMLDDPNVAIPISVITSIGAVYSLMIIALFFIQVKRLQNLGSSGWMCLLQFVPILNIWLAYRICICPEGYADHKTLDKTGKILIGIFAFFIILLFLLSFLPTLM